MNVFIYNPNSRGGNYDYAVKLAEAYPVHPSVHAVSLILPSNASAEGAYVRKILLSDQPAFHFKLWSKIYFIWRSLINPIRFYLDVRKLEGFIIFNDYDQSTAHIWVKLFRRLKSKFVIGVLLHDPDRDLYFRNKGVSEATMKKVMSLMDIAMYHEVLPEKSYYAQGQTKYLSVPHGIYETSSRLRDEAFYRQLVSFKGHDKLIGALGNIRKEKNIEMIVSALSEVKKVKLLIAGLPANTSISVEDLKHQIEKESLQDRILFIPRYLNEAELAASCEACDSFILYYAHTFKSQSGMLNLLAPFKKNLLVSDNDSALTRIVKKFNLGLVARADSKPDLIRMLRAFEHGTQPNSQWESYYQYASWTTHVSLVIKAIEDFRKNEN
jgi:glycosyltransferase involved in cell wall biosynthesis